MSLDFAMGMMFGMGVIIALAAVCCISSEMEEERLLRRAIRKELEEERRRQASREAYQTVVDLRRTIREMARDHRA